MSSFYQAPGHRRSGTGYQAAGYDNGSRCKNSLTTAKWWTPANDKQQKEFEKYKQDFKTILTVHFEGIPVLEVYGTFVSRCGAVELENLGFQNFGEFLFHCDDIMQVRKDHRNSYYIFLLGGTDADQESIRKMVEPRNNKPNSLTTKARIGNTMRVSSDNLLHISWGSGTAAQPLNGISQRKAGSHSTRSKSGRSKRNSSGITAFISGVPKLQPYICENDQRSSQSTGLSKSVMSNSDGDCDGDIDDSDNAYEVSGSSSSEANFEDPKSWSKPEGVVPGKTVILLGPQETQMVHDQSRNVPPESRITPTNFVPAATAISDIHKKALLLKAKTNTIPLVPWQQMKMPTAEYFSARILGVDSFGFVFIELNNDAINKGFDELKRSIHVFYSPEKLDDYRLDASEMAAGAMVVACIEDTFARANIYEIDVRDSCCILVDLEGHDFHTIGFDDIYKIDERFRSRRPRALMCTLYGLETHMMTEEITDAFEVTQLDSSEVLVKVISHHSEMFHEVPCVTMMLGDGNNVAELLKRHGSQYLDDTRIDVQSRKNLQTSQFSILKRKNYFPSW